MRTTVEAIRSSPPLSFVWLFFALSMSWASWDSERFARILSDRHHVTPTGLAARRVDERRLIRRADHRQMATQDGREQHPDGDPERGTMRLARDVKKRHLAYRCGDTGILGSRGECVAPAHRGAERRHAIRVNAG